MALSRPRWVSTWATAATSPIHDGVEGTDVGLTWMVTAGCAILLVCPPLWETVTYIYSLTRRHISSVLSSFSHVLLSYAISLRIPWDYLVFWPVRSGQLIMQCFEFWADIPIEENR